jgi:Transglutaminase-like superfamily
MPNMSPLSRVLLFSRLVRELFRYDLVMAILGFRGVRRQMPIREFRDSRARPDIASAICEAMICEAMICEAVGCITPFYWKPVKCLQRSVVTARALRAYGIDADVVIGYRLAPFLSHAWVEVGGRIVNDSPVFQHRLQVLERI